MLIRAPFSTWINAIIYNYDNAAQLTRANLGERFKNCYTVSWIIEFSLTRVCFKNFMIVFFLFILSLLFCFFFWVSSSCTASSTVMLIRWNSGAFCKLWKKREREGETEKTHYKWRSFNRKYLLQIGLRMKCKCLQKCEYWFALIACVCVCAFSFM